ncbi:FAEL104Wp [Eremothecium gossypii FDAG1]|nr:FAEL104Wp [Eremothecium gossypii FDAG1]
MSSLNVDGTANFTTPVIEYYAKFMHSPPSRDSVSGTSPTTKFLKTLSGGSIRRLSSKFRPHSRNSGLQQQQISYPQPVNRTLPVIHGPSGAAPVSLQKLGSTTMQGKKRPTPLNLKMVSQPLAVQKTSSDASKPKLGSPMKLRPPSKMQTNDLRSSGKTLVDDQGLRLSIQQSALSNSNRSPDTYAGRISTNYASIHRRHTITSAINGGKRYNSNACSICGENLNALLAGERIVELTCDHQSHYHCYFTLLEVSVQNDKYPRCQLCGQERKPKSDEILTDMKSSILLTKPLRSTQGSSISAQVLGPTSATGEKPLVDIYTPCEQLLKSADVGSNGFCSSYNDSIYCANTSDEVTLEYPLSATDSNPDSRSPTPSEGDCLKVNVIPQMNKLMVDDTLDEVIVPFVLNCFVPGVKKEDIDAECLADQSLRADVNEYISNKFSLHLNGSSPLRLFDRLNYSLDGNQWTHVVVYCFEKCLLLVEQEHTDVEPVIIGKIPMEHLSRLYKYNSNTIILDLKSISLPEVYLQDLKGSAALINKWHFYLSNAQSRVPVALQTTNCWQLLPQHILDKVPKELISYNQLTGDALGLTASLHNSTISGNRGINSCGKSSKLQIVVAVSLFNCQPELHSNEELLKIIQQQLRSLKYSLHEDDLLGIVVAAKEGFNNGRFYGMVSKNWELWDEIIDDMRVTESDNGHVSDIIDLHYIMEASSRLLSMVEGSSDYIRQLVILSNDYQAHGPAEPSDVPPGIYQRLEQFTSRAIEEYKFSITQLVTKNSHAILRNYVNGAHYNITTEPVEHLTDINCQELIHGLHQKSVPQVQIELQSFDQNIATFKSVENKGKLVPCLEASLLLQVGCLKPGESRSLIFEMRIDKHGLRRFLADKHGLLTSSPDCAESPSLSLVHCHYAPAFSRERRRAACSGVAFSFNFCRRGCSPIVSLVASPVSPDPAAAGALEAPEDDLYVDIPLVAPLSPARDAVFVGRQIQLLVVDALGRLGVETPRSMPCVSPARLRELVSVLFGMSRDCACTVPAYVREAHPTLAIHQQTEALCKKLEQIVDAYEHGGRDTDAAGIPHWAQLARALYLSLM